MNKKELIQEGKQIEQELKALHDKLRAETKELKKRFRTHIKSVDRFCTKNYDDIDLCNKVVAPLDRSDRVIYYIHEVFEGWSNP